MLVVQAYAQTGSPFDLAPRLDSAVQRVLPIPAASTPEEVVIAEKNERNPFDLIGRGSIQTSPIASEVQVEVETAPVESRPISEVIGSVDNRGKFDAILSFVLMLLLTVSFVLQGGAFRKLLGAVQNNNLLNRLQRDQRKTGYLLWSILGGLCVGSFVFVAVRQLYPASITTANWLSLDMFILATLAIILAKLGLLALLGIVFPIAKPIESYQTLILVWIAVIGVLLFPAIIMVCFSSPVLAKAAAYTGIGLLVISLAILGLRALIQNSSYLISYPLHFFLYLCALEIGPLAVVFKLLIG